MAEPLRLCRLEEIPDGQARGFSFGSGTDRIEIFVYRRGATLHGYENACPHQGTPLNFLADRFMNRLGNRFLCTTHGAQFRIEDGYCINEPCEGKSLKPIALRVEANEVFWLPR
jgi:nitrite reductase/ring-hydroxylating ferredoxin subunit